MKSKRSKATDISQSVKMKVWEQNHKEKHKIDAKYGFYKYDTTFSFDYNGQEKTYTGIIVIRNDANGKKYLYDIVNIKPQKKLVNLPSVASNSNKSSAINDGSSNQFIKSIPQTNTNVKSDTNLRKLFYKYCDLAKVPQIRLYDLRHTYVALMMNEGWELYHISKRIGHINYSTTVDKYGHLENKVRKEVAKTTDKYL